MASAEVDALRQMNAQLRERVKTLEVEKAEAEAQWLRQLATYDAELSGLRSFLADLRTKDAKHMREEMAKKPKS